MTETSYFIASGNGFTGSHFMDRLRADPDTCHVTVYDNFSAGRAWHLASNADRARAVTEPAIDFR